MSPCCSARCASTNSLRAICCEIATSAPGCCGKAAMRAFTLLSRLERSSNSSCSRAASCATDATVFRADCSAARWSGGAFEEGCATGVGCCATVCCGAAGVGGGVCCCGVFRCGAGFCATCAVLACRFPLDASIGLFGVVGAGSAAGIVCTSGVELSAGVVVALSDERASIQRFAPNPAAVNTSNTITTLRVM